MLVRELGSTPYDSATTFFDCSTSDSFSALIVDFERPTEMTMPVILGVIVGMDVTGVLLGMEIVGCFVGVVDGVREGEVVGRSVGLLVINTSQNNKIKVSFERPQIEKCRLRRTF